MYTMYITADYVTKHSLSEDTSDFSIPGYSPERVVTYPDLFSQQLYRKLSAGGKGVEVVDYQEHHYGKDLIGKIWLKSTRIIQLST